MTIANYDKEIGRLEAQNENLEKQIATIRDEYKNDIKETRIEIKNVETKIDTRLENIDAKLDTLLEKEIMVRGAWKVMGLICGAVLFIISILKYIK